MDTQSNEVAATLNDNQEEKPDQPQASFQDLLEWRQNELVHSWKSYVVRCMGFSQTSKRKWRRRTRKS